MTIRKLILIFGVLLISLVGVWGAYLELAHAHAEYERSEPAAGAVIPETPAEVHVWFTQELFRREGANTLEVYDPDGTQVDNQDARIDDDDRKHMLVSLPVGLPVGAYTVRWHTLSADDGDTDRGEFTFTVDPAAVQATPQPTPTVTPMPTPSSLPTPSPIPPPSPNGGLPCLSGVVLGGSALGWVATIRRRSRGRG